MIKIQGNNTPGSIILKQSLFTNRSCCAGSAAICAWYTMHHITSSLAPLAFPVLSRRLLLFLFRRKLYMFCSVVFQSHHNTCMLQFPGTLGGLFTSTFASDILNHITINLKLSYKFFLLISVSQKNRESRHLAYLTIVYFAGITNALSPAQRSHSLSAALPNAALGSEKSKLIKSSAKHVLTNGLTQNASLPA